MDIVLKPASLGTIDLATAGFLYFTTSPVPEIFAAAHLYFLGFKGLIDFVEPIPFPTFTPFLVMFGAVDLVSAAILYVGNPPIPVSVAEAFAAALFIKGIWSLTASMAMG